MTAAAEMLTPAPVTPPPGVAVPDLVHVPTPGDHYSAATGSAVMTIIYEWTRLHEARGGRTQIVVGDGTRHDYPVGRCVTARFRPLPGRVQKLADVAAGRLGFRRPLESRLYRPALDAIDANFDGVVFLWNAAGAVRLFRAKLPRATIVLKAENELFNTYSPSEARRTVMAADRVIGCSRFVADAIELRVGPTNGRVLGITNGVDAERFHPTPPPPGPPVVLFVGRVVPEKGVDLLVRAAAKLCRQGKRFVLRVVGSSNFAADAPPSTYEQELRRLAAPMGPAAEFRPFVDRVGVRDEYAAATIFCAPSNWDEPCSLTVPEAIACGLPTVASRRGGIPEVGGDAVLYFDPPNVDELAGRIGHLLDDAAAREALARRARVQALNNTWQRQYERVLHAAMNAREEQSRHGESGASGL